MNFISGINNENISIDNVSKNVKIGSENSPSAVYTPSSQDEAKISSNLGANYKITFSKEGMDLLKNNKTYTKNEKTKEASLIDYRNALLYCATNMGGVDLDLENNGNTLLSFFSLLSFSYKYFYKKIDNLDKIVELQNNNSETKIDISKFDKKKELTLLGNEFINISKSLQEKYEDIRKGKKSLEEISSLLRMDFGIRDNDEKFLEKFRFVQRANLIIEAFEKEKEEIWYSPIVFTMGFFFI